MRQRIEIQKLHSHCRPEYIEVEDIGDDLEPLMAIFQRSGYKVAMLFGDQHAMAVQIGEDVFRVRMFNLPGQGDMEETHEDMPAVVVDEMDCGS